MAALNNDVALITWEFAKETLDYRDEDKLLVETIINAIGYRAIKISKRNLKARDFECFLPGYNSDKIILQNRPVNRIEFLYIDPQRKFPEESRLYEDHYDLDEAAGIIYLLNRLTPNGRKTVKIKFNAGYGYNTRPIPDDLQLAALESVSWIFSRLKSNNIGIKKINSPDGLNTEMEITIPLNALRIFESYSEDL